MRSQAEEFHKPLARQWASGRSRVGRRASRHVCRKEENAEVLSWRVEAHAHTIEVSFGGWSRAPRDLEELPNHGPSKEGWPTVPGSSTWECWVWAGGLFLEGGRPEEYAGLFDGPYANTQ